MVGLLCFVFMLVEFFGGFFSNSQAIMADAAHMLSDLCAIIICILSIVLSRAQPTISSSYGYHRTEVFGALISIVMIWIIIAWLLVEATHRVHMVLVDDKTFFLDAKLMLLTSLVSFIFNIINLYLLGICSGDGHGIVDKVPSVFRPHMHQHGPEGCGHHHDHNHDHSHDDDHSHDNENIPR